MKKTLSLLMLATVLLSAGAQADVKIAVLNAQRAILESDEAQAMIERFNQETATDRGEVEQLQNQLLQMQERVRKDGEVMSDDEKRQIAKDAEGMQVDLEFKVQKLRKQTNDKLQEVIGAMSNKFDAVVQDLIDVEGYDVVIPRQNVHWVNPKHDITRRVTEKLNERR